MASQTPALRAAAATPVEAARVRLKEREARRAEKFSAYMQTLGSERFRVQPGDYGTPRTLFATGATWDGAEEVNPVQTALGLVAGDLGTVVDLPGDMRSNASALDQDIRALIRDVDAQKTTLDASAAGHAFLDNWTAFVKEWEHFTEQDQGPGQGWLYGAGVGNWWSAGSVSQAEINLRRDRLKAFRDQMKGLGAQVNAPDPQGPGASFWAYVPWLVAGVVVIALSPTLLTVAKSLTARARSALVPTAPAPLAGYRAPRRRRRNRRR